MTTATRQQIAIGPEFFAKAKNDYADWHWAIVREFLQNSVDAPHSRHVDFTVRADGANTTLIVANDGEPMSHHVLTHKLLSLGSSGKDFAGTVGGFGKAKELLYFTHVSYQIRTGDFLVVGRGGMYDLEETQDYHDGTTSTVQIAGNHVVTLMRKIEELCSYMQWSGSVTLNGEKVETRFLKGRKRREFPWCEIWANNACANTVVVRIGGVPMFTRYTSAKKCVVVELKGSSDKVLTSNRDGLNGCANAELAAFLDELSADGRSALVEKKEPHYTVYEGDSYAYTNATKQSLTEIFAAAYATLPQPTEDDEPITGGRVVALPDLNAGGEQQTTIRLSKMGYAFLVKNTTGMKVAPDYTPVQFSTYAMRLAKVWARCMVTIHEIFEDANPFKVGFLFDENDEAQFERSPQRGTTYLLNPVVVVKQTKSNSRSMKRRWKLDRSGKFAILADAVHEYVHSLVSGPHNEEYAGKLTEVMGVVMRNLKRFNSCF